MPKSVARISVVRIIGRGTYRIASDIDPIKERYGEKLRGVTICFVHAEDRGVSCTDFSIYYCPIYWDGGGIKLIDQQQNGCSMANQGGTVWKEGDGPEKALRILGRILEELSQAKKVEKIQEHL